MQPIGLAQQRREPVARHGKRHEVEILIDGVERLGIVEDTDVAGIENDIAARGARVTAPLEEYLDHVIVDAIATDLGAAARKGLLHACATPERARAKQETVHFRAKRFIRGGIQCGQVELAHGVAPFLVVGARKDVVRNDVLPHWHDCGLFRQFASPPGGGITAACSFPINSIKTRPGARPLMIVS